MGRRETIGKLLRWLAALIAVTLAAPAFAACGVADTDNPLGTQSPAALRAGAVPYAMADGGFSCTSGALVSLLANNYLRATVASGSVLTLSDGAGGTISYLLAGAADGTSQLKAGIATDYVGGNGTTILALGQGVMKAPVYVRPSSAATVPAGTYTGSVNVRWDWRFCSTAYVAGACVGVLTQGSGTARITIRLSVAAKPVGVQISAVTTWDPVSGTTSPKTLPGSKQRVSVTLTNPDVVAIDLDTLAIVLPTFAGTAVALDGDGKTAGVVQSMQGTPASALTLSYVAPSDLADDVDFSSNGGASWVYAPIAGDAATQAAVTQVRFRPKGSMAAQSAFTMSIPYSVK